MTKILGIAIASQTVLVFHTAAEDQKTEELQKFKSIPSFDWKDLQPLAVPPIGDYKGSFRMLHRKEGSPLMTGGAPEMGELFQMHYADVFESRVKAEDEKPRESAVEQLKGQLRDINGFSEEQSRLIAEVAAMIHDLQSHNHASRVVPYLKRIQASLLLYRERSSDLDLKHGSPSMPLASKLLTGLEEAAESFSESIDKTSPLTLRTNAVRVKDLSSKLSTYVQGRSRIATERGSAPSSEHESGLAPAGTGAESVAD